MKIGELIKQYRDEHAMSMDSFAHKTGLSKSYVSMLERNKDPRGNEITPSIETIYKVSKGVNMPFDDVFKLLDQNQKVVLNSAVDDNLLQTIKALENSVFMAGANSVDTTPEIILEHVKKALPALEKAAIATAFNNPSLSVDESDLLTIFRELSDARKQDVLKIAKLFDNERG